MDIKEGKKVVFLCSDLGIGGIQRVTVNLANGLAEKNIDITCAVLKKGGEFIKLLSPKVNLEELNCTSSPFALLSPLSGLRCFLKRTKPDIVVSFGHTTNNLASWAKISSGLNFKLIASEHSTFGARMKNDSSFQRKRRIFRARFLYRRAECCVCVSDGVAEDLTGLGVIPPEKAIVIYNPIYDDTLKSLSAEQVNHEAALNGTPFILAVGRLVLIKGYDDLIRAFHILLQKRPRDLHLVLIGDGAEKPRLERLVSLLGISGKVYFTGWQSNPYSWMAKAECVVLTSHFEGLPSVLAEAMACGTNVVSVDCPGGAGEILENGRWGKMPKQGDIDGIATAIDETLKDPVPANILKKAAERFSAVHSIDAWHELLSLQMGQGAEPLVII